MTRDSNGNRVSQDIRRERSADGQECWGVNVWFGGVNGLVTNVERRLYETRQQAREADISVLGDGLVERTVV